VVLLECLWELESTGMSCCSYVGQNSTWKVALMERSPIAIQLYNTLLLVWHGS